MRLHLHALGLLGRLPRRSVRLRLTALYGGLFVASGTGLLAITNVLARGWPWPGASLGIVMSVPSNGSGRAHHGRRLSATSHQLQVQAAHQHAAELSQLLAGSAVALGVMAVVSVALGWIIAGRVLRPLREMKIGRAH